MTKASSSLSSFGFWNSFVIRHLVTTCWSEATRRGGPWSVQYRGIFFSMLIAHASIPPAMLCAREKPCWRNH
jgi:hypothetical protein